MRTVGRVLWTVAALAMSWLGIRWWWRYQRLSREKRRRIAPSFSQRDFDIRNPWTFLLAVAMLIAATVIMWIRTLSG